MHTYKTRGDITTHDMFILNRACHPSYDFIWKAHVWNTWATRWEDGIRWIDHSINPHNSRDAAQHTYKTRGSSSLVVQEGKFRQKVNVLGVTKINRRLISHLKEPKIPSRAPQSNLSLTDHVFCKSKQSWQILFKSQWLSYSLISGAYNCSDTSCDNPPRKIPYYRLNQSTLALKRQ
jgi:hypothetical protein